MVFAWLRPLNYLCSLVLIFFKALNRQITKSMNKILIMFFSLPNIKMLAFDIEEFQSDQPHPCFFRLAIDW